MALISFEVRMLAYHDQLKRRDPNLFLREVHLANEAEHEPWDRFTWNVTHLFDFKSINPYVKTESGFLHGAPKRTALQDIGHSIRNLWQSNKAKK